MTKDEALKLALEALEGYVNVVVSVNNPNEWTPKVADAGEPARKAITAIKEALAQPEGCQCPACKVTPHTSDCSVHSEPAYPKGACNCGAQPEQEPVAWMNDSTPSGIFARHIDGARNFGCTIPLYTTPPQRKPLTDEEIMDLCRSLPTTQYTTAFARAIEAAHGIKGEV